MLVVVCVAWHEGANHATCPHSITAKHSLSIIKLSHTPGPVSDVSGAVCDATRGTRHPSSVLMYHTVDEEVATTASVIPASKHRQLTAPSTCSSGPRDHTLPRGPRLQGREGT